MNSQYDKTPLLAIDLVNRVKTFHQPSRSPQKKAPVAPASPRTYSRQKTEQQHTSNQVDENAIRQLYSLFKQQGLNNGNGLLKFMEIYRKDAKLNASANQNQYTNSKKPQSACLKKYEKLFNDSSINLQDTSFDFNFDPKPSENDFHNRSKQSQFPVSVIKCDKMPFNKPRCASTYQERNRLSVMISNAKMGLNLLEDKINSFQNPNQQQQPSNKLKISKEYFSKNNCNELMNQSDQHQYLYECLPYRKLDENQRSRMKQQPTSEEQNLILQSLQQLISQNQQRDMQMKQLHGEIESIKQYLDDKKSSKRNKKMMQNLEVLSQSPQSKTSNGVQPTPQKAEQKSSNAYTFNIASSINSSKNYDQLKLDSFRIQDEQQSLTLIMNNSEMNKPPESTNTTDLREFIIHTQSQQFYPSNDSHK